MSSKTGATSAFPRGPVVRTRVASRAPEVRVSIPEATLRPSLLARCGSKVSGWVNGMGDGTVAALVVGSLFAVLFMVLAVTSHQDRSALQRQIRDLRIEHGVELATQKGVTNYQRDAISEMRSELSRLKRALEEGQGSIVNGSVVRSSTRVWTDNPDVAPPPPLRSTGSTGRVVLTSGDPGGPK